MKNVTGRLLVAMRWWNEADDSGSAWRFESAPEVRGTIRHPASVLSMSLWEVMAVAVAGGHGLVERGRRPGVCLV